MNNNYKPDTELPMVQRFVFCDGIRHLFPALDIKTLKLIHNGTIPSVQVTENDLNEYEKANLDTLHVPEIWLENGVLVPRSAMQLAGYVKSIHSSLISVWVEQEEVCVLSIDTINALAKLNRNNVPEPVEQAVITVQKPYLKDGELLKRYVNLMLTPIEKRAAIKHLIRTGE